MTQVVIVAKIGRDAEEITDPNDAVFHSSYNTFKIILEDTKEVTLAASTNNQSFTQAHGLDFIPLVDAFAKRSGVNQVFKPNGFDIEVYAEDTGYEGDVKFNYISVDATNITFNFDNAKGSQVVVSIRYFCLEKI